MQTSLSDYFSRLHARSIEISISLYLIHEDEKLNRKISSQRIWDVGSEEPWSRLNKNFGNFRAKLVALDSQFTILHSTNIYSAILSFGETENRIYEPPDGCVSLMMARLCSALA